jgi:AraC-like DNA-binding protein
MTTKTPITVSVPPLPLPGSIRLAPFMALPAVLAEFGYDPRTVLAAVGLSLVDIADPDKVVPFATIDGMLRHSRDITGCEHFGLLVGQRVSLSSLGLVGFTMNCAENVATALANLSRYRALHDRAALISLEQQGDIASLRYTLTQVDVAAPDQIFDFAVAVGCRLLRGLCGPDWKPSRVMLGRERPALPAPYEKFFRGPLVFDSEWSGLEFNRRWLGVAPVGADPLLYRHMLRELRELDVAARDNAMNLISSLRMLLYTRQCKQSEAAALLGVNGRTLRRQLQCAGTTFRGELEAARFARARTLLAESDMSSQEIAGMLGYADVSAFSHAFKRWSGVSPSKWRMSAADSRATPLGSDLGA